MSRREILIAHYTSLIKGFISRASVVAMVLMLLGMSGVAQAAQITSRSLTLGVSTPSASTTYAFAFTIATTGTPIKSFQAQACTTAIGTCTTPTGWSGSVTLTGQPTGFGCAAGWTAASLAGYLELADASCATNPSGSQTVSFSAVTNPSPTNTAFYMRMTTYSGSGYTGVLDTGNVAASTDDATTDLPVTATVAEFLQFCVGATVTASGANPCGTVTGTSVTVPASGNPLSTSSISTNTSGMGASTNAGSGLVITYNAGQFTNGSHNFANGFGSGGSASSTGTEEFGLNATASGTGAAVASPYNGTNYAWNPATTTNIANSGGAAIATGDWTVTYGANVAPTTPYGAYTSTFIYVCTPTF
jgi:hypothetical protein